MVVVSYTSPSDDRQDENESFFVAPIILYLQLWRKRKSCYHINHALAAATNCLGSTWTVFAHAIALFVRTVFFAQWLIVVRQSFNALIVIVRLHHFVKWSYVISGGQKKTSAFLDIMQNNFWNLQESTWSFLWTLIAMMKWRTKWRRTTACCLMQPQQRIPKIALLKTPIKINTFMLFIILWNEHWKLCQKKFSKLNLAPTAYLSLLKQSSSKDQAQWEHKEL